MGWHGEIDRRMIVLEAVESRGWVRTVGVYQDVLSYDEQEENGTRKTKGTNKSVNG